MNISWIGSPNYDTNRKPIKRVIIHWIVGNLASADAVFQDKNRGTSAHYAVEDGNIHQYVKEEHVAYHAGNYAINQESIGIEHSASPDREASEETYQTAAKLISSICERYGIPIDRDHIEPHKKYKATQCPGTMNIDKLIELARGNDDNDDARIRRDELWNSIVYIFNELGISNVPEEVGNIKASAYADIERRKKDYDRVVGERDEALKKLADLTEEHEACQESDSQFHLEVPVEETTGTTEENIVITQDPPLLEPTQEPVSPPNQPVEKTIDELLTDLLIKLWRRIFGKK